MYAAAVEFTLPPRRGQWAGEQQLEDSGKAAAAQPRHVTKVTRGSPREMHVKRNILWIHRVELG